MTSCGSSPTDAGSPRIQDLIIGKREMVGQPGVTEEFTRDGKSIRKTRTCQYALAHDGKLEYLGDDGKPFATYKVAVTRDELTSTSGDNRVEKFKRVK